MGVLAGQMPPMEQQPAMRLQMFELAYLCSSMAATFEFWVQAINSVPKGSM
jgi:hypothetical protein